MRFVVFILIVLIPFYSCTKKESEDSTQKDVKTKAVPQAPPEHSEIREVKETPEDRAKEVEKTEKVRPSALAGSWYPGDRTQLSTLVRSLLNEAHVKDEVKEKKNHVFALIAPHAGYRFSGTAAAHGYKLLSFRDIRRIILLGPSHYAHFSGASILDVDFYETPLGKIPLDKKTINTLRENSLLGEHKDAHVKEHCLEIQLPFLQSVLEEFSIVPVLIGQMTKDEARSIGQSIKPFIDEETVIIVSSDFTHYGPNYGYVPFSDNVEENIHALNVAAFKNIEALNTNAFIEHKAKTGDTICGFNPIIVLLSMAQSIENVEVTLLAHDTSGSIMNDFSNSVSYLSIALTKPIVSEHLIESSFLDHHEQEILLKLSRLTLERHLEGMTYDDTFDKEFTFTENLKQPYGVFVTLKKHGQLRGCIGTIVAQKPLYLGVIDNTINAAAHDRRFTEVTKEEKKDIEIELSVLSQPGEISSYREIVPGRDGIILSKEDRRAVFLPQVLVDNQWTPFTALRYLSQKAGLHYEAWRENAQFYVFSAQVFHETQLH